MTTVEDEKEDEGVVEEEAIDKLGKELKKVSSEQNLIEDAVVDTAGDYNEYNYFNFFKGHEFSSKEEEWSTGISHYRSGGRQHSR